MINSCFSEFIFGKKLFFQAAEVIIKSLSVIACGMEESLY